MKSELLLSYLQAATLATASILPASRINAQSPAPASSTLVQHTPAANAEVNLADPDDVPNSELLRYVKAHGKVSLFDVFQKDRYQPILMNLISHSELPPLLDPRSAIGASVLRNTKLKDIVDNQGHIDWSSTDKDLTQKVNAEVAKAVKDGLTLDQASKRDFVVAEKVAERTDTVFDVKLSGQAPLFVYLAQQTKMSELFGADGLPDDRLNAAANIKFDPHLFAGLQTAPLRDLDGALSEIKTRLFAGLAKENERNQPDTPKEDTIKDLFNSQESLFLKVLGEKKVTPTFGDILDPNHTASPRISLERLMAVDTAAFDDADKRSQTLMLAAAHSDISVGAFLSRPPDTTGYIAKFYLTDPLVRMIADPKAPVPKEVSEALQHVPLSQVVTTEGHINPAIFRDAALEGIKDKSLKDVAVKFLYALNPELDALVMKTQYRPQDETATRLVETTKFRDLQTDGNEGLFLERAEKLGSVYTSSERAEDAVKYEGRGTVNPWLIISPEFAKAHRDARAGSGAEAGTTPIGSKDHRIPSLPPGGEAVVIPFSFDVQANKTLYMRDISETRHFTEDEEARFRYVAWRVSLGSGAKLEERNGALPSAPDKDGELSPRGILAYGANLSKTTIFNDPAEQQHPAAFAIGSFNPLGTQRVDLAFDVPFVDNPTAHNQTVMGSMLHETEHGLGEDHPFGKHNPVLMPGTIDATNAHHLNVAQKGRDHFVTTDEVSTSYDPGAFVWLSPTPTDTRVNIDAYGPSTSSLTNKNPNVVTVKLGDESQIVESRDPLVAWVGPKIPYAQTILTELDKPTVFDFRKIGEEPVRLNPAITLDLSKATHDLWFLNRDNVAFQVTRVATLEANVHDAVLTRGEILGTSGADRLQVEAGGILDGRGGPDRLTGGTKLPTTFRGGEGLKTFVIRSQEVLYPLITDQITNYKAMDVIIAPENTSRVTVKRIEPHIVDGIDQRDASGWSISFLDAKGHPVKAVEVHNLENPMLSPQSIRIENVAGETLTPTHQVAPRKMVPRRLPGLVR